MVSQTKRLRQDSRTGQVGEADQETEAPRADYARTIDDRATSADNVGPAIEIVIACAMEEEAKPFLRELQPLPGDFAEQFLPPSFSGPTKTTVGTLFGKTTLLVVTGIGLTNAVIAATSILSRVIPKAYILAGTTGGLHPDVQLGDLVVATSTLYHDADATAFGYLPGQVPRMPAEYTADERLVELARTAVADGFADPDSAEHSQQSHFGMVSSSNSFVDASQVSSVRTKFPQTLAVDMETAAAAQTCWSFACPWISLRAVSDLCDPDAGKVFETSAPNAYQQSFELVKRVIAGLQE